MSEQKGRCVREGILAAQKAFAQGGGFKDAYHSMRKSFLDPRMTEVLKKCKQDFQHVVAFGVLGTALMVGYIGLETYVNAHGGNMPDLKNLLSHGPVAATILDTKLNTGTVTPGSITGGGEELEADLHRQAMDNFGDPDYPTSDSH
jgi:hypothetical protein